MRCWRYCEQARDSPVVCATRCRWCDAKPQIRQHLRQRRKVMFGLVVERPKASQVVLIPLRPRIVGSEKPRCAKAVEQFAQIRSTTQNIVMRIEWIVAEA